jgi:hypothetical protein
MKIKSTVTVMIFVTVIVALVTITVGAIIDFSTSAFAGEQQQKRFITELTGFEEVPPVKDNIMYTLNVTDIENVTAAHIHGGQVGENGPIVVTLFKEDAPTAAMTTGVLSEGNITATNLEGPMAGKLLSNLTSAMRNEQTYVNVHTQQNPNGEIRGQILNGTSAVMITK